MRSGFSHHHAAAQAREKEKSPRWPPRPAQNMLCDRALGGIRTPDPQIRSLVLYPAELRAPRVFTKRRTAICCQARSSTSGSASDAAPTMQNLCDGASALALRAGHAMTKSTQQRNDHVRSTGLHEAARRELLASFARTQ